MVNFTDWKDVNVLLKEAQDAEYDNREFVREVTHFLKKRDGQWEPLIIKNMQGRPRYTFDKCNPVVKSISGELKQADFDIQVKPAGGDASKEVAKVIDGMVRNIENISNASHVFNASAKKMIETGFDAWRVTQEWADSDSFDQDLFIRKISNAVDRVWFDTNAEMQDMSDAMWCFVLQTLTPAVYKEKFPEGSGLSVGDDRSDNVYYHKPQQVVVGEFLYKKEVDIELVLMGNNKVYKVDDDFDKVVDDLERLGVKEERRRTRKGHVVYSRKFDGADWLEEEKETVFEWIPVIPTYGNFEISENKVIYHGVVLHLMDAQRAYNYAQSRQIEEGALAPRAKYWGTKEQRAGHSATIESLNTNANAWQDYTHVDNVPPPFFQGGAQINPGLQQTSADMANNITETSGIFAANQGQSLANQSGIALERLQNKGDISSVDYYDSQEVAICHTARIIIDALPKVYDSKRLIRVLNEDGSFDMESINDTVIDQQSGEEVVLNDLTIGKYDVTCSSGPAFQNRQQETVKAITELGAVDPSIIAMGGDVLLNNIAAPGIDLLAQRKRAMMIQQGVIPFDQLTDEEKQQVIQAQQQAAEQAANQPQDPVAQAFLEEAQAKTADVVSKTQERNDKSQLTAQKQQIDLALAQQKQQSDEQIAQQKLQLQQQEQLLKARDADEKQQNATQQLLLQQNAQIVDSLNTMAQTLKTLREAQGVDVIVGPHTQEAFIQQAELVTEAQDGISPTLETQQVTDQITGN